jgi:HTH-type transcriptional regulator / antitoxin HipB
MSNMDLGKIVRFHRKKAGLSQFELARLAGVGKTAVFDIEKGKDSVQLDTILKILTVLNIKMKFESPLMDEYNSGEGG